MPANYRTQNPTTGEITKEVPFITDAELAAALDRASAATATWRATPIAERAAVVRRVSELFISKRDELARIIATEMGKPLGESYGEVDFSADIFRYFAEAGPGQLADQVLSETDTSRSVVQRRPLGTILGIMPWNYPVSYTHLTLPTICSV